MAFPNVAGSPATSKGTARNSTTSLTSNLPAGIVSGELLEFVIATDGAGEVITFITDGWTKISEGSGIGVASSFATLSIWMKIADGTEGATVEWKISSRECWATSARRIENHGVLSLPGDLTLGTLASGSGRIDPPNCDPGVSADYLFRTYGSLDQWMPSGPPGNYNHGTSFLLSSCSFNFRVGLGVAGRQLTATSDNPGEFLQAGLASWVSQTIAIPPAPSVRAVTLETTVPLVTQLVTVFDPAVSIREPGEWVLSASTHIAASGEATTPQLTPPAGKTTADHSPGRIQDDENPADATNPGFNQYEEVEFSMRATAVAYEGPYEFRFTRDGVPLDAYLTTPNIVVTSGLVVIPAFVKQLAAALDPAVTLEMTAPFVLLPVTVFDPAISHDLAPSLVTQLTTVYDPTLLVGRVLKPTLVTQLASTFNPMLIPGARNLNLNLVTQLVNVFDPQVGIRGALFPTLVQQRATAYDPTFGSELILTLVTQPVTIFDPVLSVAQSLTPALVLQPVTVHDPALLFTVAIPQVAQLVVTFNPTLAGEAVDLAPSLVTLLVLAFNPVFNTAHPTTQGDVQLQPGGYVGGGVVVKTGPGRVKRPRGSPHGHVKSP